MARFRLGRARMGGERTVKYLTGMSMALTALRSLAHPPLGSTAVDGALPCVSRGRCLVALSSSSMAAAGPAY
eukprot:CAMPEP_0202888010 /NCGR_PEP_ID=MMETSP1391-20130828/42976_1 /ASSEMBLY_ACC=CAM_ASM_000867 /TAXON_ID=1034604 /ORGANISM="Chlamydomonas leiostraca, Strain SAG 11-49" /LENGTH=71 /DNA_ID=CAMNT_0049571313 /DNA_START=91 /DNA_END=306 /DNA_ORIENTATION=-